VSYNPASLPVDIDGTQFLIDTRQYRRITVPALREQRDTSKEPGENTLDTSGAWTRSQTDWSYGAGQTHFDLDDSDRRRFSTSAGIDPWTKGQITLLNSTEQKVSVTDADLNLQAVNDDVSGNTFAYYSDGQNLKYTSAWTGASRSASTADMGYDIKDFASDGSYVYAAFGSTAAIRRVAVNNATYDSGWGGSAVNAEIIGIVSGRFIGALGGNIFELDVNGAKASSSLDYTATLGATTWVSFASGPSGIFAAANTNGTGSIHHIGVATASGTLNAPTIAGELPRGESINKIISYNGIIAAATSAGLRIGLVDTASNAVTIGPVIDNGGAAYSLDADNRFIWWGGGSGQVYRVDLTRFTETLVPAWAPDIVSAAASGNVQSVARFNGKTYFAERGQGVYGESGSDVKVASGSLTVGEVSWSTVAPKLLRSVTVRQDRDQYTFGDTKYTDNTPTFPYTDATLEYRGDPTSTLLGSISFTATNDNNASSALSLTPNIAQNFDFVSESSVSYKFVITLGRSSSTTEAPIIEDWLTTCIATPARVDEILVPIVLRRQVLTSHNSGAPATFNSNQVFTSLRQRMESGQTVTYKEGDRIENVTIERLEMQAERLSDDEAWWEGTLMVRLLTVPS